MNNNLLYIGETTSTKKLTPNDSHKSFYGKAKVEHHNFHGMGADVLISYTTPVLVRMDDKLYRTWDGWSATTGRHIRAFADINKKQYWNLPLFDYYRNIEALAYHG